MNRERACNILDISQETRNNMNETVIKKHYHLKALQYHPDKYKEPEANARFQEIQEAYQFLLKYSIPSSEESNKSTYKNILTTFLQSIWKGEPNETMFSIIIEKIVNCCESKVIDCMEKLDNETLIKIHDVFSKYKSVFHFSDGFLKYVEQVLANKIKNDECIVLNPSIDDLFECNLYKITEKGYTYIVPLWHQELVYDNSGCDLYVRCKPILPENIYIDEDNNIHVHIQNNIIDIFNEKTIEIVLGNRKFSIYVDKLYIKPKQTIVLRGRGIPRIIVDDIYNVETRGNIHIHIELIL